MPTQTTSLPSAGHTTTTIDTRNWCWCQQCNAPSTMDRTGHCAGCGSDAVAYMGRIQIAPEPAPTNGYIAFWKRRRCEVYAHTLLEARYEAAKIFHAKHPSDVAVMLAEKAGKPVIHVADF